MKFPNFAYERKLWAKGNSVVTGADEVGRGSFAGPVVAACVVFPRGIKIPGDIKIDDSKKLSAKKRGISSVWIKENSLAWGIGEVPVGLINRIGMAKATLAAFRRAVANTKAKIDFLLMDAFYIPFVKGIRRKNQLAIIDGDAKCFSIAGASIIAKVYRDALMQKLGRDPKYRNYDWESNKGYGTKKHREAIEKYGLTRHHRKQFVAKLKN